MLADARCVKRIATTAALAIVVAGCGHSIPLMPNAPVIVIVVDTLRADHLPSYGYSGVLTPTMSAIAADASVFERCLSHSPQTLPSHASLFTGELPFHHGVRDNAGFTLDTNRATLASTLRDAGYATAGFVSAFVLRADTGIGRGFDHWDDRVKRAGPRSGLGGIQRSGPDTVAAATAWLDNTDVTKPFFLFVHLYEPHTPYDPPEPLRQRYASAPYDGEIAAADAALAPLFERLRRTGVYDRAVVVLLSDHGEGLNDHGEAEHGIFLYEEIVHVPLFIKPAGPPVGRRVGGVATIADIAPTVMELVGVESKAATDGRSLVAAMGRGQVPERVVYAEAFYSRFHFGWSELTSATDGRWRYIQAPRRELYDITTDPNEQVNLHTSSPDEVDRLHTHLSELTAGAQLAEPAPLSASDLDQLRSLGYLAGAATPSDGPLPDPKDRIGAIARYQAALAVRKAGDLDTAASAIEALLRDEPRLSDAWESLARIQLDRGKPEPALQAAGRLAELLPGRSAPHLLAAQALLAARRPDAAYKAAELAVPGDAPHALELMCRIRLEQGRLDDALQLSDRALAADPELPIAHFARGVSAAARGDLEAALTAYQRAEAALARQDNITLRSLHLQIGDVLARLGRESEAEVEFRREFEVDPDSIQARLKLAALCRAQGRRDESIALLVELVGSGDRPHAYAAAVHGLATFGEHTLARTLLAQGLKRYPDDAQLNALDAAARRAR